MPLSSSVPTLFFLVLLLLLAPPTAHGSSSSSLILRVRLPDGSMERVNVASPDNATLQDVVQSLSSSSDTCLEKDDDGKQGSSSIPYIQVNGRAILMRSKKSDNDDDDNEYSMRTVRDWGLRQGSLLTIVPSESEKKMMMKKQETTASSFSQEQTKAKEDRWDPFPDLATDYQAALLQTKRRRARGASLSYADLANLQSSLHLVEAQPTGPIERIYMCQTSAERFQISIHGNKDEKCSAALLLGTVQRERKNPRHKARTSLSSTTEAEEYCQVAKVEAVWEPPTSSSLSSSSSSSSSSSTTAYDATPLLNLYQDDEQSRVLRVAQWLDLQPVGWIYSYKDDRMKSGSSNDGCGSGEDALPVWIRDVVTGSTLQILNMQSKLGRIDGSRFVTLAMDAQMGATEAFQLSDVAVQMVAEDMLVLEEDDNKKSKRKKKSKSKDKKKNAASSSSSSSSGRFGTTKHPILVDGKETTTLDSVLCLVNTAMLSHQGLYSGKTAASAVKRSNGRLTTKTRKSILKALLQAQDSSSSTNKLFTILANFQVLLALDEALQDDQAASERLVTTVRKWARGQKKGTVLDSKLVKTLQSRLEQ